MLSIMDTLKTRIRTDGKIFPGNILKVDGFINHQIDVMLLDAMAEAFQKRFADLAIDRILTIEASGIALAVALARRLKVPVVFAKKSESLSLGPEHYRSTVYSYTKQKSFNIFVSKDYLHPSEQVLIVDDFLANGQAVNGLIDILNQAQATCVGIGIAIEKGFQSGGKTLRTQGFRLESLAIIQSMDEQSIVFDEAL
jgi:xanthine phosphoribosyltransferase